MNDDTFWNLMAKIHDPASAEPDAHPYSRLKSELETLPLHDLLDYTQIFSRYIDALLKPNHLAAAFLLNEGTLGFDSWMDYLEDAVAVPKNIYLSIVDTPDKILDYEIYQPLLHGNGCFFHTVGIIVGEKVFGVLWNQEFKKLPQEKNASPSLIEYEGRKGYDILTPETCRQLVPRFFELYSAQCDWR